MIRMDLELLVGPFQEVPPLLQCMHDHQHLFVVDLVVPFHVGEAFGHKAYQVEQPILLLLRQDSSCGKVGGVALQMEETRPGGEGKCGGRSDGALQRIKGLLFGCTP